MKYSFRAASPFVVFAAMLVTTLGGSLFTPIAHAKPGSNSKRGTVTMKGPSTHGGSAAGQGTVIPNGGYYVAPSVSCTLVLSGLDLLQVADGTVLDITLEYVDPNLAPVVVGSVIVSHGAASFTTGANPVSATLSPIASMSVRWKDGTVLLSGTVRGL